MKKIIVDKKYNNKKLSVFLLSYYPKLSINTIFKALRKKDIRINNARINKDIIVYDGDTILLYISDELLEPSFNLKIVFEDDNILIIDKPYNIEVTGEHSLTSEIHKIFSSCSFKPMPCHRLDRNTTGLVLFAKNEESLNILLDKFKKHEIKKHYLALVYGIPVIKSSRLKAYLFKDSKKSLVYISDTPKTGYSEIITSYTVIQSYDNSTSHNNTSLLDVEIETGKTHQIRAHLSHIGFPVIGDGKYGNFEVNKKFGFKFQKLHSYILKFNFSSDSGILNYLDGFCVSGDVDYDSFMSGNIIYNCFTS
ncbi:MAG: RluA family pseudouridine synthase [Clostridia bacterium]|nr:RluA family pseudouridine synthase [Clostridia bacterium]